MECNVIHLPFCSHVEKTVISYASLAAGRAALISLFLIPRVCVSVLVCEGAGVFTKCRAVTELGPACFLGGLRALLHPCLWEHLAYLTLLL